MVNYPTGILHREETDTRLSLVKKNSLSITAQSNNVKFAKRGMNFEAEINETNNYYLSHGIAVIHKKPTPIQVVRVEYPQRSRAKIVEAYYRQASTTDYSGVFHGHYIDFEAKETHQKTVFPLKNFHAHQIRHMKAVLEQGGLAFALLHFSLLEETYYLDASLLIAAYEAQKGLKSLTLSYIREQGILIPTSQIPRIPYIDIINKELGGD